MNSNPSQPTGVDAFATPTQDSADLWRQMSQMKAEMENYKAELTALRQEVTIKEPKEAGPASSSLSTSSRRRMLKQMVAGAAGLSALSLAAVAGSSTAFAETSGDNGLEVTSGANGYGIKITSPFAQLQLVPAGALPTSFTGRNLGELFVDSTGALYYSVATTGTSPNAWRKISGPSAAGVFNLLLPTSDRFVDTRPGAGNIGGRNTPLTGSAAGTAYTFQITGATGRNGQPGQIIPAGATAVFGNLTLVANVAGAGPVKVLPGNATDFTLGVAPIIYSGAATVQGAFSAALGPSGDLKVVAFNTTGSFDILIDIVGYYI